MKCWAGKHNDDETSSPLDSAYNEETGTNDEGKGVAGEVCNLMSQDDEASYEERTKGLPVHNADHEILKLQDSRRKTLDGWFKRRSGWNCH